MTTVNINNHEVEVTILSFDPGEQPQRYGHPDNWTPGEPAEIEFVFSTDNELLNELLTENHYNEAKDQLLAGMK
jgi:hypothetical protein